MIKLSILIPSIPSRLEMMAATCKRIVELIGDRNDIEVLVLTDNKMRSIGMKRDALVQAAIGEYLCFVDDDDEVYDNYITEIINAIEVSNGADVIAIQQHATINGGNKFIIDFSVNYENEEALCKGGVWQDTKRKPFHVCPFKRSVAQKHHFPDANYGEDWHWCERVLRDVTTSHKTNTPIMCYNWASDITEAKTDRPQ